MSKISVWRVTCPRCRKGHVRVQETPALAASPRGRVFGVYDDCLYCGTTQEEISALLGPELPEDSEPLDGDKTRECSHLERELALCEVEFGAEHPSVAVASSKLGALLWELGDAPAARGYLERAAALLERLGGAARPQLLDALATLAAFYVAERELSRARVIYERLILLHEASHGAGHPIVAGYLSTQAGVLQQRGYLEEACRYFERALAIYEATPDPKAAPGLWGVDPRAADAALGGNLSTRDYMIGMVAQGAAELYEQLGVPAQAKAGYERALAIWQRAYGPEHSLSKACAQGLGRLGARPAPAPPSKALPPLVAAPKPVPAAGPDPARPERTQPTALPERSSQPTPAEPPRLKPAPPPSRSLPAVGSAVARPPGVSRKDVITAVETRPAALEARPATTRPRLSLVFQGKRIPIEKEEFVIGRTSKGCDLVIKDNNVSRKHALILYRDGQYLIKDNDSINGIHHKGIRISAKPIEEGDVLMICDYELAFSYL